MNRIYFKNELKSALKKFISKSERITLISAYLTNGIFSILDEVSCESKKISLYIRGNKDDFISGAVCLNTLRKLHLLGVQCYLVHNLHLKAYIFDDDSIFIGSANLTNNGLVNLPEFNIEMLYLTKLTSLDLHNINDSLVNNIKVTNYILDILELIVLDKDATLRQDSNEDTSWFAELTGSICIAESDLPCINHNDNKQIYDEDVVKREMHILGYKSIGLIDKSKFLQSNLHRFILYQLSLHEELYFGEIKKLLRSCFPYIEESNLKAYVRNIFSYYFNLNLTSVIWSKPNYSEKLSIKK